VIIDDRREHVARIGEMEGAQFFILEFVKVRDVVQGLCLWG